MAVFFIEAAALEASDAIDHYKSIDADLERAFREELSHALDLIECHPHAWTPINKRVRRCLLKRFPYVVFYVQHDADLVVIAVAHTSRRPFYWRSRLRLS